jgi:aldose sugar dehydrogenase
MVWSSIAPCGLTQINGTKYPAWQNNLMVASLRFNYINRCVLQNNKVVKQEKLFMNAGRMRNVEMGTDGYMYIATENPGMVFRVVPL